MSKGPLHSLLPCRASFLLHLSHSPSLLPSKAPFLPPSLSLSFEHPYTHPRPYYSPIRGCFTPLNYGHYIKICTLHHMCTSGSSCNGHQKNNLHPGYLNYPYYSTPTILIRIMHAEQPTDTWPLCKQCQKLQPVELRGVNLTHHYQPAHTFTHNYNTHQ